MSPVFGSTSAKTGVAAWKSAAFGEATKVIGVVTTSSPGPTPRASSASTSPIVQLETPTTSFLPRNSPNARSKTPTLGPSVRNRDFSVSATDEISASPRSCLKNSTRSIEPSSGKNPAIHGDVVECPLDVGEKLILAQRVPAAVVGIDRSGLERREHFRDCGFDRSAPAQIEPGAHAIRDQPVI